MAAPSRTTERTWRVIAALALVAAIGSLGAVVSQHEAARARYEAESARLERGEPEYDATRSDEAYRASADWASVAERAALGLALLMAGLALARPRAMREDRGEQPDRGGRALLATLLDGSILAGACTAAALCSPIAGPSHAALGSLLAAATAGAGGAALLATRDTPGARAAGVVFRDGRGAPGRAQQVVSALLLPAALLVALLAGPWVAVQHRRGRAVSPFLSALHWRVVGVRAVRPSSKP